MKKKIALIGGIWLLCLMNTLSWGESISHPLPSTTLPEQVSTAITKQNQPAASLPTAPITLPGKTMVAHGEASKLKFKLTNIILEGNHIYTTEQLAPLYADKIGKVIPVVDLFTLATTITNYYRNHGYILSKAILPPQHVKKGVVRIRIVEGYLDKVVVTGNPGKAQQIVQAYGQKIAETKPLRMDVMEKYLLLANELPGTDVRGVLSPAKATGATDLTLTTQYKPITGYFNYDNYGTRYIGPQQMTANLGLNSLLRSGDTTQFTLSKTPKGEELTYIDVSHTTPLGSSGTRLLLGATPVTTTPLFTLEPLDVKGNTTNYYSQLQYPLIRTRSKSLTLQVGFNYMNSRTTSFGEELYNDHLRPIGIGANYVFADKWQGSNVLYADIRHGLPIFGYTSSTDSTTTSRFGGRGTFTKIDLNASRNQYIHGPYSLYGAAKAQYAFNPVLAGEAFSFGGSQMGRGYDPGEIIGDRGLGGSLELRRDFFPERFHFQLLQLYAFYDIGAIWNLLDVSGQPKKQSIASTGLGMRFYTTKYVSGNLMFTQPLTKQVSAEEIVGRGLAPRTFFSLLVSFN